MTTATDPRPNFIYILADDLGYADLGCMGARDASGRPADITPNLDRLAAAGVRFTRGYSNSSVCSPTRFSLITGRWQYRIRAAGDEPLANRAKGDKVLGLDPSHPTLPSLLRDAGYATALIGKWHLGYRPHFGPLKSGYQEFFGYHSGGVDYFRHTDPRGDADLWVDEEPVTRDGYMTDLLSDAAVQYVERQSAAQPFLLSLHYSAPHWPWETRDDRAESDRIAGDAKHLDGGSIGTYQRMIHHMDEGIGRVMAALERRGLAANTMIVFTSDNGGERFSNNWPFVGQKMDLLEGGIRVPLVARWPQRIAAGSVRKVPNLTMDWTATMLAAAKVPAHPDYPLDGVSLLPAFASADWEPTRDLCWRMKHRNQHALIRDNWKYLSMDDNEYLFDLSLDERERANLSGREPQRLALLRAAWQQWDASLPPIPEDAVVSLVFGPKQIPRATF